MSESWLVVLAPTLLAIGLYWVPGLCVLAAGWRLHLGHVLVAPAVSVGVLAVAATVAPVVGLGWSLVPAAILTVVTAAVAGGVRWWASRTPDARAPWIDAHPRRVTWAAAAVGLGLAAVLIVRQCLVAFVGPESISQTFDGIVHLNTIRWAVNTANASAFHVGLTSDVPFYPNGWHVVPSLLVQHLDVSVPVAVNATGIAIAAFVWPAAAMALGYAFFRGRPAALVAVGVLASAFGAFPLLLFDFGVLYPNALGYALVSGVVAWLVWALPTRGVARIVRETLGLLVACAGLGLAHPNSVLVWWVFAAGIVSAAALRLAARVRTRRAAVGAAGVLVVFAAGAVGLWTVARTGYAGSRWLPWETAAQAFGEGVLVSPNQLTPTPAVVALIAIGAVALALRPQRRVVLWPYVAVVTLFVFAAGVATGNPVREALTNPWYNDPFRLAALLPLGALPVAVAGAVALTDAGRRLALRIDDPGTRSRVVAAAAGGAVLALAVVVQGGNVGQQVERTREMYAYTDDAAVLSAAELMLLNRLDATVPADALIAGSPRTGTSLAYAIADREVLRKHVFGQPSADEQYLSDHLRDINTDPRVCRVINEFGVDYVLDFGTHDVHDTPDVSVWQGMTNLTPGRHLVLVDSEGADARLFRIAGC